ncbi:MAG TPA: response regulator [Gemmatimonadaceae bacterium]|jgi:DNA-binding NtrC family response regulator|nr:response regulator [Gemmatimonadaceae bacterium]
MTRHALVVDDNALLVRTLCDILRLAGWEVTPATSGDSAVHAVEARDFDVVLMDIKMPGVNGVEAFRAMRSLRPGLRVVLMSAYAAPDLVAAAEREGVASVMSKPVDPRVLLALLDEQGDGQRPVLIIDTDAAFLTTLSGVLRTNGYETVVADNLLHATRLLEEQRPLAVLLHLHLGGVGPRDAVTAVHSANPESALIVYSGCDGAEHELDSTVPEGWVHTYLQKPFPPDKVTQVLKELRDIG